MPLVLPIAVDNADAMRRVGDRFQGDVGSLIAWAKAQPHPAFWAICRTLFPIAESIAFLLLPPLSGTSERLSELFNQQLAARNPRYGDVSYIICQIWRHGLTHGDEPPTLVLRKNAGPLDDRAMSWRLLLPAQPTHLTILNVNDQSAMLGFSLESFYDDLLSICRDPNAIAGIAAGVVAAKYNHWTVKEIQMTAGTQEERKAATQIDTLLP